MSIHDGITFKVPHLFETCDKGLTKPYAISHVFSNNQPAEIFHQLIIMNLNHYIQLQVYLRSLKSKISHRIGLDIVKFRFLIHIFLLLLVLYLSQ